MSRRFYSEVREYSEEEALEAMRRNDGRELHVVVVGVALYGENSHFAEDYCMTLAAHVDEFTRGNAVLGFGHIARRFGSIVSPNAIQIVEAALKDPSEYVRGQAWAAASDISHFLKIPVEGFAPE